MTGWLRNVLGADKANDAQVAATSAALAGDEKALAYLQEREQLPMQIRDQALTGLSQFYQVPGGAYTPRSDEEMIAASRESPLFKALMGTKDYALDQIQARASATGQLRSGNAITALAREGQRVNQEALLRSFEDQRNQEMLNERRYMTERGIQLEGLGGLAGLQGNQAAIAGTMSNMGQTQAQGLLGQAQTQTSATNNAFNTLLGFGQMAASFSDLRLKTNVRFMGTDNGFNVYKWDWNDEGRKLGLEGESVGVLAHEIYEQHPDAVGLKDGFLTVDYSKLVETH